MDSGTIKKLRIGCLIFAVLWFAVLLIFEARYFLKLARVQPTLSAVLRIAYYEQVQGLNLIVLLMYLAPGTFAWFVHRRFRKY